MAIFEGVLERLGESIYDYKDKTNKYSIIRIGDSIIRDIYATQDISSFLDVGTHCRLHISRVLWKKLILSVEQEDGTKIKLGLPTMIGISVFMAFMALIVAVVPTALLEAPAAYLVFALIFMAPVATFVRDYIRA